MSNAAVLSLHDASRDRTRQPALDGLRGSAVLMVFLGHTSSRDIQLAPWLNFDHLGMLGVYLFFVLSGYLLARQYRRGQSLREYIHRRAFRILPLYYVVLCGTILVQQVIDTRGYLHISGGFPGWIRHFALLDGHGVFWSIPTECAFYVLLPMVVWMVDRWGARAAAGLAVVYFAYVQLVLHGPWALPDASVLWTKHATQYIDVFLIGVLAAYTEKPMQSGATAAACLACLGLSVLLLSENLFGLHMPLGDLRSATLAFALLGGALTVATAQGNPWLTFVFSTRWLRFLGEVGFSWYLLHMAVLQTTNAVGPAAPLGRFLLAFLLCCAVSWIAFHTIEAPAMRWGCRRIQRLKEAPAGETAGRRTLAA